MTFRVNYSGITPAGRIAVCTGIEKIEFHNIPIPVPGPDEIQVEVALCGVCRYDLKRFYGKSRTSYPVVLGHELSGRIISVGASVSNITVGELVAVDVNVSCGECEFCQRGNTNKCTAVAHRSSGGFATQVIVPCSNVHSIQGHPDWLGIFIEPIACIIHGLSHVYCKEGQDVLVVGDGPMGILHTLLLSSWGVNVTVIGHHLWKLKWAEQMGAIRIVTIKKGQEQANLKCKQFDGAVLTAEDNTAAGIILGLVREGGWVLFFAGTPEPKNLPVTASDLHYEEKVLTGSVGYNQKDFCSAVKYVKNSESILSGLPIKWITLNDLPKLGFYERSLRYFKLAVRF
jgi:L-iditol 2-dehydrogenase